MYFTIPHHHIVVRQITVFRFTGVDVLWTEIMISATSVRIDQPTKIINVSRKVSRTAKIRACTFYDYLIRNYFQLLIMRRRLYTKSFEFSTAWFFQSEFEVVSFRTMEIQKPFVFPWKKKLQWILLKQISWPKNQGNKDKYTGGFTGGGVR